MTQTAHPEFLLSIAGITGHLTLNLGESLVTELRNRYDDFLIPPAPWVSREFSLRLTGREMPPQPAGDKPPVVHSNDREIGIGRWDFEARLESGGAGLPWTGTATIRESVYSIDTLLRILWSILLRRAGGGLFHACGLRAGEDGVLFPGVSGAGKTTLARKAASLEEVLSDEIVPVRRLEDGTWRIYASPFWGEFGKGRGSLTGYRLSGVGFLKKSDRMSVDPVAPGEAAQRLLETLLCFELDPQAIDRNVEIALRLASEVPIFLVSTTLTTPSDQVLREISRRGTKPSTLPGAPRKSREVISELRSLLKSGGQHAIVSKGGSMRPFIRSGDTLFIQALGERAPSPGDVLVTWIPGETAEGDALICHRMIAGTRKSRTLTKGDAFASIERVRDGREAEILGIVVALSRKGEVRPLRGRLAKLARVLASLAAAPVVKVREAFR
jgi:hypothetical protein